MLHEIIAINPRKKPRRRRAVKRSASSSAKRSSSARRKKRKTTPFILRAARPMKRKKTTAKAKKKEVKIMFGNPRKRRTRRAKRRAAPTARKIVYRTRRPRRRALRRIGGYAKQTILGLNIPQAAKNAFPLFLGALLGKAAAHKLADSGSEAENWTWKNYLLCMAGGGGGGILAQALFKRPGLAQKILEGAILLTLYKIWVNEIAPKNATLQAWFGQDESAADPYAGLLAQDEADPYAGLFGPVTETPEGDFEGYAGRVVDAGPRMGGDVVAATPTMGAVSQQVTEMFNRAYR